MAIDTKFTLSEVMNHELLRKRLERLALETVIATAAGAITRVVAHYTRNSAYTVPDATLMVGDIDDLVEDTHSAVSGQGGGSTWLWTCPVAGDYLVDFCMTFDNAGTDAPVTTQLYKNGSIYRRGVYFPGLVSPYDSALKTVWLVPGLIVGDTLVPQIYQASGLSVNTTANAYDNYVKIRKIV